jgi:hypothetical protein
MENVGATITVTWGYGPHTLRLSVRDWHLVRSGASIKIQGEGYYYEGEFFQDYWYFSSGLNGPLVVEYGKDGGTGFVGRLSDAEIEEV